MGVDRAGRPAIGLCRVADIRSTVDFAGINAPTEVVAVVLRIADVPQAGLLNADRGRIPQRTEISPVAGAILVAGGRIVLHALALRIRAGRCRLARARTVADPAQAALDVRVGVIVPVLALADKARYVACPTVSDAVGVAAVAVHTETRLALIALHTGRTVGELLFALVVVRHKGVAPVRRHTMGIVEAVRAAGYADTVTLVRCAIHDTVVVADPVAVAGVVLVLQMVHAVLGLADRAVGPEMAHPVAVAGAVQLAGMLPGLEAILDRVITEGNQIAHGEGPVTGKAGRAVVFRIRACRMRRASTRVDGAGLALLVTHRVAAESVHAVVRDALIATHTGLAVALLVHALLRTVAPVHSIAMGVVLAVSSTRRSGVVADVRITGNRALVCAEAHAVTLVGVVQNVDETLLGIADGPTRPQTAGAGAIAVTVEVTSGLRRYRAFFHGVGPIGCRGTGAAAVADLAQRAVVFRV